MATFTSLAQVTRRVLFLGDSYIYTNNLPQIAADIAHNMGDTLVFDSYAPGGYTLDNHSTDAASLAKVAAGNWDYVVLQEQSQLPSFPIYFSNGLSGLCENIRAGSPCGRIMFYMTWGRKNGDASNCPAWPPVCTYLGMDSLLRLRYIQTAANFKAELSPVGAAWRYARLQYPAINLYQPDESHPSAAGSYLAACSFYAAIFKKNPLAINYNYSLTQTEAAQLRQAAKAIVHDSLSYWNYSPTIPTVSFTCTTGTGFNQVNCQNQSADADTYLWNFGDGMTSALKHPSHNYSSNGTYTITLTGYNCDIGITYQASYQAVVSFCAFTPTVTPSNLTLCPGSTDTLRTQNYSAYQWYDVSGTPVPNATHQYLVCTGNNIYYVKATQNGCTEAAVPVAVDAYNNLAVWNIAADGKLVADTACSGDTITLHVFFDKPPVPYPDDSLFDWQVNGAPVTGYHNDSLIITQTGTYSVMLRHAVCPSLNALQQASFVFVNCPAGIQQTVQYQQISIYPNPSDGVYYIECAEPVSITVTDIAGRKVLQQTFESGKHVFNLQEQPSGMYILAVTGKKTRLFLKLSRK